MCRSIQSSKYYFSLFAVSFCAFFATKRRKVVRGGQEGEIVGAGSGGIWL